MLTTAGQRAESDAEKSRLDNRRRRSYLGTSTLRLGKRMAVLQKGI
jgi:hypothetical protein